jgi:hypothetical protein
MSFEGFAYEAVVLALAASAIYCGGAWLWIAGKAWKSRVLLREFFSLRQEVAETTFRLGLCFVLSAGFLGLLLL